MNSPLPASGTQSAWMHQTCNRPETKESASEALLAANAEQGITDKCMETIDKCEFARFAPSSDSSSREKVYNDAVTVITDLEAVLK